MNWAKWIKIYSNISNKNANFIQFLSLVTTYKALKYSAWFGGFILAIYENSFQWEKYFMHCEKGWTIVPCLCYQYRSWFESPVGYPPPPPRLMFIQLTSYGHFFLPDPPCFPDLHPLFFFSSLFQRRWSQVGFVSWYTTGRFAFTEVLGPLTPACMQTYEKNISVTSTATIKENHKCNGLQRQGQWRRPSSEAACTKSVRSQVNCL